MANSFPDPPHRGCDGPRTTDHGVVNLRILWPNMSLLEVLLAQRSEGRTLGKSRLSKGVGAVYRLRLLAPKVTGVKCKPGVYLSQSNMLCNREQWALCERLFRQQPQVQDYSALHPELCGTKILEFRAAKGLPSAAGNTHGTPQSRSGATSTFQLMAEKQQSPQVQSLVAENQNAKPNHLMLQLSSVGISEPKRAPYEELKLKREGAEGSPILAMMRTLAACIGPLIKVRSIAQQVKELAAEPDNRSLRRA
ncbi:mCG1041582 [Mus musculus]|nr:mCG1041582 [Mus musculus]